MQSLFSSVIKNNSVLQGDNKKVITKYDKQIDYDIEEVYDSEEQTIDYSKYKEMANNILKDAEKKSQEILKDSEEKAAKAEKEAYEKGYEQGQRNGYEDGYKESYEKNIEIANNESQQIIQNAKDVLMNANNEYKNYLKDKKEEIIKLAMTMAEAVAKTKLETPDGLNDIIKSVIRNSDNTKTFVIRCNSNHVEAIKSNVDKWKELYATVDNIFVVSDESIEPANAVIERDNGKTEVGIDVGFEKIEKAIF